MSKARDLSAIAYVQHLGARHGQHRGCRCERCTAVRRVVALAREAVAMKEARKKVVASTLSKR